MILVRLNLKFLNEGCGNCCRNFKFAALGSDTGVRKHRMQGNRSFPMCASLTKNHGFREDQFRRIAHPAWRHY